MRVNSQLKSQFYPQNKTAALASLEGEAEKDSEGYNGGNGLVLLGTCSDGDGAEALWRDHPDNSEGNFQAVSSPHNVLPLDPQGVSPAQLHKHTQELRAEGAVTLSLLLLPPAHSGQGTQGHLSPHSRK